MKSTAAVILNRNLPDLADELGQWMIDNYSDILDLHVIENGSDVNKYSKFANICFQESLGPARGINEGLKLLLKKDYDYFWINFNDARYREKEFIRNALNVMKQQQQVGIVTGYWEGNMNVMGKIDELELLSFFDPLGFVVSRKALEACMNWQKIKLDPLWDSSNFSNHFNILGTALALYESGLCMVTDKEHAIYEKEEVANLNSVEARGFDNKKWKEEIGPSDAEKWFNKEFPKARGSLKKRRDQVIKQIEGLAIKKFSGNINNYVYKRFFNFLGMIFNK